MNEFINMLQFAGVIKTVLSIVFLAFILGIVLMFAMILKG